jgi:hypothetical protein
MRRGLFIGGIVLLIIGILAIGVGYAVETTPVNQQITGASALTLQPQTVGNAQVSISWSGGSTGTDLYLVSSTPDCFTTPTSSVAHGSGASGSLSASLSPGTTYYLFINGCPTGTTLSISYTPSGLTYLMLIGVVIIALGAILAVLGARLQPRPKYVAPPEEPAPAPAYVIPTPIQPTPTTAPGPVVGVRPAAPAPPPRFMPASESTEPAAVTSTTPSGPRANRTCASCGTINEPWLTNCRKCTRPLGTTGT